VSDVRAASLVNVASLFAGVGGSSIGYRTAGFDVQYACEKDAWARDVYKRNAPPGVVVDDRSVEDVAGAEILAACGGVVDVLDGSPPCQSWSMAGRRRLGADANGALLFEFVRLVGEVRSRAFVLENVEGLAKGQAKPYFLRAVLGLKAAGYRMAWDVLDASWYGVPQARRRLVVIGFRKELQIDPRAAIPRSRPVRTVMGDALPDLLRLVVDAPSGQVGDTFPRGRRSWAASEQAPTLMARGMAATSLDRAWVQQRPVGKPRPISVDDLLALQGFPADFCFPKGSRHVDKWKAIGNAVPPPLAGAWARSVADALAAQGALSTPRTAVVAR
jgi:DNA (cytosine-5)-methyltransferase 1